MCHEETVAHRTGLAEERVPMGFSSVGVERSISCIGLTLEVRGETASRQPFGILRTVRGEIVVGQLIVPFERLEIRRDARVGFRFVPLGGIRIDWKGTSLN